MAMKDPAHVSARARTLSYKRGEGMVLLRFGFAHVLCCTEGINSNMCMSCCFCELLRSLVVENWDVDAACGSWKQ